jgi:hypothetical protein
LAGNFFGRLFCSGLITGADRNPALFGGQLFCAAPAQPPACGRNQRDFAIDTKVHLTPPQ